MSEKIERDMPMPQRDTGFNCGGCNCSLPMDKVPMDYPGETNRGCKCGYIKQEDSIPGSWLKLLLGRR